MRVLRVRDVVVSFFTSVAQLAYAKLDPETRDLDDARVAIETLRALVPVLEGALPEETVRDLRQAVSNLQLAYAGAASRPGPAPEAGDRQQAEEEPATGEEPAGDG
jgi:hypothetical protein